MVHGIAAVLDRWVEEKMTRALEVPWWVYGVQLSQV